MAVLNDEIEAAGHAGDRRVAAILAVVAERVSQEIGATNTARIWPLIEAATKALAESAFQQGREVASLPRQPRVGAAARAIGRQSDP
ncbi:hypothetical protein [Nocardia brasiliensis]|uniref:hypothetical protein n=1 Tax=Nocardia brasiliensis TaxID=37326 RepID=UPI002458BB78|nr:hypothetical protein [Nocardia brasiliensis]